MPPITHTPPAPAGLTFPDNPGRPRLERLLFWLATTVALGSATLAVLA